MVSVITQAVPPGPCTGLRLSGKPQANSLHIRWGEYFSNCYESLAFQDYFYESLALEISDYREALMTCRNQEMMLMFCDIQCRPKKFGSLCDLVTRHKCFLWFVWWDVFVPYVFPAMPEFTGGAPFSDYEVLMTNSDNSTSEVYRGPDTDCTVTGLLPGRNYLFQVRCLNRAGVCLPWCLYWARGCLSLWRRGLSLHGRDFLPIKILSTNMKNLYNYYNNSSNKSKNIHN